jgi:acetyltransferase-like isoleucine patch superfamily enzyme
MKLDDLIPDNILIICPQEIQDMEVKDVAPLDQQDVQPTTLRWWNGKALERNVDPGGIVIVPISTPEYEIAKYQVRAGDPKATFMHAVERLYAGIETPCLPKFGLKAWAHSTAVIGGIGFGFHNGTRVRHIGHVVLGDDVEVGAHTCIDRGTLGDTIIGDRTKVDNLVHIAHNVRIGTDCLIIAGAVIGGSAVIGNGTTIGIGALVRNGVRIGNNCTIGMGAVVVKDVPDGATVYGNPAREPAVNADACHNNPMSHE